MNWRGWLNPFARFQAAPTVAAEAPAERNAYDAAAGSSFGVNRFDFERNEQLGRCGWRGAHSRSVNADLETHLRELQARCQYAYHKYPYFRGVVRTLRLHVVGKNGPRLQVRSKNKRFNQIVEKAFKRVMEMPDPAGRLSGAASLGTDVTQLCLAGSSLAVAKNTRREGPVKFGWQTIHPRRLVTPPGKAGDPFVALGKRFDGDGRCVEYYFDQSRGPADVHHSYTGLDPKGVPADAVAHVFLDEEGEQITGVPLMASSLDTADDLAEYDKDVMEAAKQCAKETSFLESASPEAIIDPDPVPAGGMTVERGKRNITPQGWRNVVQPPTHPMTQYTPFRHERLAELGRPVHMPLMLVLLSSRESNFSSAQFDGMIYAQGVGELQAELTRQKLLWAVENVVVELVLAGVVERPGEGYTAEFTWDVPPHANLDKVAKSLRTLIEDGVIAPEDGSAFIGHDYENVVERRRRNAEMLDEAELPPPPVNHGSGKPADDPPEGDPASENPAQENTTRTIAVDVPSYAEAA